MTKEQLEKLKNNPHYRMSERQRRELQILTQEVQGFQIIKDDPRKQTTNDVR